MAYSETPRHQKRKLSEAEAAALSPSVLEQQDLEHVLAAPGLPLAPAVDIELIYGDLHGTAQAYVAAWDAQSIDPSEYRHALASLDSHLDHARKAIKQLGITSEVFTRAKDEFASAADKLSKNDELPAALHSIDTLSAITQQAITDNEGREWRSVASDWLGMEHKGGDEARRGLVTSCMRIYEAAFSRSPAIAGETQDGGPFGRFTLTFMSRLHSSLIK